MKWPWVSREQFEACERFAESCLAGQRGAFDALAAERASYAALLDKYHALKLSGAGEPEPKGAPVPRPEPDPVIQAIIAKSKGSQLLRKHYNDFVREQRGIGMDETTIAAAIMAGHSLVDDGIPG